MDKDHKDEHKTSDYKAEKMRRSSSSGSCEVDTEIMNYFVSVQGTTPAATFKCNICGKTFKNGKALGGHRRSHIQAAKKKKKNHPLKVKTRFSNHSKVDSNNNRASCGDNNEGEKPTCYLCKKQFTSKNALFGHMRYHPERVCRGVCPPTNHSHEHNDSSFPHNSDSFMEQNKEGQDDGCVGRVVAPNGHTGTAIDLSKSTSPSWQKTDRRGRKCVGLQEAAENLVYLSAGSIKKGTVEPKSTPEAPKPSKKRKIDESSSTGVERMVKKVKLIFFSGSVKLGKKSDGGGGDCDSEKLNRGKGLSESGVKKISVNVDGKEEEGWVGKEHCGEDVNESSDKIKTEVDPDIRLQDHVGHFEERKVKKVKKGKKGKKTKDSTYANGAQEKMGGYKCDICGKSFSTFQGLGGHRSIHKEKNFETIDESKHYSDATVAGENNSCSSIHVPKVEETPLSEEKPLAGEAISQSTVPKKLDFDLNEPYVMED